MVRDNNQAHIILDGDQELARSYIPLARTILGKLRSYTSAGVLSNALSRTLPDGTKIRVRFSDQLNQIIHISSGVSEKSRSSLEVFNKFITIPRNTTYPFGISPTLPPIVPNPFYPETLIPVPYPIPEFHDQGYNPYNVLSGKQYGSVYVGRLKYGNVDWTNRKGDFLSWKGPQNRYWGRSAASFESFFCWNGILFQTTPPVFVLGAAIRSASSQSHYLILCTADASGFDPGTETILAYPIQGGLRQPNGLPNTNLGSPVTIATRAKPVGEDITNQPWFFNSSGTQAKSFRFPSVGGQPTVELTLNSITGSITETNHFQSNRVYHYVRNRPENTPPSLLPGYSFSFIDTSSNEEYGTSYPVACDYKEDDPVYIYYQPSSISWAVTQSGSLAVNQDPTPEGYAYASFSGTASFSASAAVTASSRGASSSLKWGQHRVDLTGFSRNTASASQSVAVSQSRANTPTSFNPLSGEPETAHEVNDQVSNSIGSITGQTLSGDSWLLYLDVRYDVAAYVSKYSEKIGSYSYTAPNSNHSETDVFINFDTPAAGNVAFNPSVDSSFPSGSSHLVAGSGTTYKTAYAFVVEKAGAELVRTEFGVSSSFVAEGSVVYAEYGSSTGGGSAFIDDFFSNGIDDTRHQEFSPSIYGFHNPVDWVTFKDLEFFNSSPYASDWPNTEKSDGGGYSYPGSWRVIPYKSEDWMLIAQPSSNATYMSLLFNGTTFTLDAAKIIFGATDSQATLYPVGIL